MKPFVFTLAAALALASLALGVDARPSPVCTNETGSTCPGIVCADKNLDGRWQSGECIILYCPTSLGGCGCRIDSPCPPPYE